MKLTDDIQYLKGVGPKSAEKFRLLGIFTLEDLLLYFPFRYEDFTDRNILELMDGEKSTVIGEVLTPAKVSFFGRNRNRLSFKLKQNEVVIAVTFFNQPYLSDKVEVGKELVIYGKWDRKKQTLLGMKIVAEHADDFEPVYHLISGIKQATLVKVIRTAMNSGILEQLVENIPNHLLVKYRLISRQDAVRAMHFPENMEEHKQALRRMKFEEFLYFQLKLQLLKNKKKSDSGGQLIKFKLADINAKILELPFKLTDAQSKVLSEILSDMASPYHMNRLLQGDVGSGKTVIAALAMYAAVLANFQSALMVPTEILARQHFKNLCELFPELKIGLFIGNLKATERCEILKNLANGHLHMVVGTHTLIQEGVDFYNLGLVITDEQHRFGVKQRKNFRKKGKKSDVLMMTATPIPRTLAITAFGDMDISIINELPKGRQPITTRWIKHTQFPDVLKWISTEITNHTQVYFISPLIAESELLDLKNAEDLYTELQHYFESTTSIALLHGKMKADEKNQIMQSFKEGILDILVSTTVVEVGVDVPNATIMVIMDADRFGLSQLHQLRGRVGRGTKKSYAILVADPKTDSGKRRMQLMCDIQSGFKLAEEDLKMRGSGEIFGVKQSGIPEFMIADIVNDYNILEVALQEVQAIFNDLKNQENQILFDNLKGDAVFD